MPTALSLWPCVLLFLRAVSGDGAATVFGGELVRWLAVKEAHLLHRLIIFPRCVGVLGGGFSIFGGADVHDGGGLGVNDGGLGVTCGDGTGRFGSLLHLCEGMVASCHPHGGMRIPAISFHPGGGRCLRRLSMEDMPMFVQRIRCGLVVVPSCWILRLHMRGSSIEICWGIRWPAASSFCGEASGEWEKNLEEEQLCKEVLPILVCNFLFFPGRGCNLGMYCYCSI